MFCYSKPILSAEREMSVVISAPSCSEMANNKIFITPQGRKSDLKKHQTLPFSCGAPKVYPTNMQDIVIMRIDENAEVKLLNIEPQDVSYAAEIRSLSLFLWYKLEVMEGSKNSLGAQILCETSTKEPGEATPHRIGNRLFLFRRGDFSYEYSCKPKTVELRETELCYSDAPFHSMGKYKFLSLSNRMLKTHSSPEPCTPNFSCLIKGVSQWIRVSPKL